MTDPQIGLAGIGVVLFLIAMRVPVAVALIGVSFVGIYIVLGASAAFGALKIIPYNFSASWQLSSVPMFLLMGYVAYHTGLTTGLFRAARVWISRLPGGLAIASVMGASGFAAVTGSSVACAAAMGRIAVPEMVKYGYNPRLATGTVAAAGTIGALIPPSILFILFGIIAQVPVGDLFLGGAVIGLLTAASYIGVILVWCTLDGTAAPRVAESFSVTERIAVLAEIWPVLILAALVFGGLFSGYFTATEAGAVGAAFCVIIGLVRRTLTWRNFRLSLIESFVTTSAIFAIAIGANILARFVAISNADDYIVELINSVSFDRYLLLAGIVLIYLVLGMFLDPIGAMLLTLPILMPVARTAGFDMLWFGVIVAKLLEIGMITPPVGMNVFVLKSAVGGSITLGQIFHGAAYFLFADMIVVLIMILFPELTYILIPATP